MQSALYDEADGFFSAGGGAGRGGADFVTSPEVGPLFGFHVARALDGWWRELDEPDPFVVVEAGAGRGRLAADVLRAEPECASALRYVLVEQSAELRAEHSELLALEPPEDALGSMLPGEDADEPPVSTPGLGPIVTSLPELPAITFIGVVLANELLDNLPVAIVEHDGAGWSELRVGRHGDDFVEVLVPAPAVFTEIVDMIMSPFTVPAGLRVPIPVGATEWLRSVSQTLHHGVVCAIDYAVSAGQIATGTHGDWLRTYRAHGRGESPLVNPGSQDITCDVPIEYLAHAGASLGFQPIESTHQRDWLISLGIDEVVAEARREWDAGRASGSLDALAARSRVHEADALTDPHGLGAHHVMLIRA